MPRYPRRAWSLRMRRRPHLWGPPLYTPAELTLIKRYRQRALARYAGA